QAGAGHVGVGEGEALGDGVGEGAGGDAAAEDGFPGDEFHVNEERLEVAGEIDEGDDLGLADRPRHRARAVADLHVLEVPACGAPGVEGEVAARGEVETKAIFRGDERALWLWRRRVAPGAELAWDRPRAGHVAYVSEGDATVDGRAVPERGTVIVEHNGRA